MEYVIEMQNVVKNFDHKEVLKGVNLKVSPGEIFGLLGPSGAGKTTIIKILTGQLRCTEGASRILGKDTGALSASIYRKMGMMMDNLGLYERLSCYDNLKLFAKIYGVRPGRISEVLKQVDLLEAAREPVSKISKGMRGRLALARAVMNEPEILFLDEPTSGLDPQAAAMIHQLIKKQQERGAAIFLTTHNMEEAAKLCDHIALLNEGKIVEYGAPKEICLRYNHQNRLQIRFLDGRNVILPNGKLSADEVKEYLAKEMVETIHSTEPDLETVFMELTGRGFE